MEENYCPDGMLGAYLYESFQLLEQMDAVVLSQDGNEFFDRDSIQDIFRIVHTLKGSSGIMMYDNIAHAAHRLEDIFYYMRESSIEDIPKVELAEYIFEVADFIMGELNKIKDGMPVDGDPTEIAEKIDAYLSTIKEGMQERGIELPPENIYAPPEQYYVAPVAEKMENIPLNIDLGIEPEQEHGLKPGDYVIGGEKKENLVGIGMDKLEKLTILVDKLVRLEQKVENAPDAEELWKKLRKVSAELESTVYDMRRAPIGSVFRRMKRVVFDASRRLSKDMELQIFGENILVDRMLLEQLTEPLMHMVRNAADHGIEDLERRRSMGKPDRGTIQLTAVLEEGLLILSVEDDGRGLDGQKIFNVAKLRGLVAKDAKYEDYTQQELYEFILSAGFTTRDEITEISGRGVGLDAVIDKVRELGGQFYIESVPGEGTEFWMEIPVD